MEYDELTFIIYVLHFQIQGLQYDVKWELYVDVFTEKQC